ncbi:MAG: cupin domain-containing protein [Novosphingobium sp.]|nr:cupin domain-containing protein [Novosphingobium sp.]
MSDRVYRRVVTGLDDQGRSCVVIDGDVPRLSPAATLIWRNDTVPADNSGNLDAAAPFDMGQLHDGGVNFILTEMAPGQDEPAFMHATDTIDYLAVLKGEITMVLETGDVVLRAGDLIVDRGIVHGWRNDGAAEAAMISVTVPARPVGKGRTV